MNLEKGYVWLIKIEDVVSLETPPPLFKPNSFKEKKCQKCMHLKPLRAGMAWCCRKKQFSTRNAEPQFLAVTF